MNNINKKVITNDTAKRKIIPMQFQMVCGFLAASAKETKTKMPYLVLVFDGGIDKFVLDSGYADDLLKKKYVNTATWVDHGYNLDCYDLTPVSKDLNNKFKLPSNIKDINKEVVTVYIEEMLLVTYGEINEKEKENKKEPYEKTNCSE